MSAHDTLLIREKRVRIQKRGMGYIAIVVDDYDRAISYYTEQLGFTLMEDTPQEGKRWVVVAPTPESECHLLLARASNATQETFIGDQCGGRVFLFLHTDDFWRDYHAMKNKGVHFVKSRARKSMAPWWCLKTCTGTAGICIRMCSPRSHNIRAGVA